HTHPRGSRETGTDSLKLPVRRAPCSSLVIRVHPWILLDGPSTPGTLARMSDAPWVYIEDIGKHDGETVTLKGWLYNKRSSGKLHFLLLRDGTGTLQGVVF